MAVTRQDAVVEGIAVGVGAGGVGAVAAIIVLFGAKVPDVLGFLGALVGAAVAVGGAGWIADRANRRERDSEVTPILEEVQIIEDIADSALAAFPATGEWLNDARGKLTALMDIASGSLAFFDEVLAHAKTLRFSEREELKSLTKSLSDYRSLHSYVFSPEYRESEYDDWTWHDVLDNLRSRARSASSALRKG